MWDFDGCLVDSETLACQAFAELATEAGFPITTEIFVDRFTGKSLREILHIIDEEAGLNLSHAFPAERLRQKREALFERSLRPIPGVLEFLDGHSHLPMCIASGSEPERIQHSLQVTGLAKYFPQHVFSSSQVGQGKPAPDIFIYAAHQLGVEPKDCLVIEDSIAGVTAGVRAGATVYGFLGGSHIGPNHDQKLRAAGAYALFNNMRELPEIIKGPQLDDIH